MGGTHARLSPSNHRWPHCPGSVREEKKYQDKPGASAIDGIGTHHLLNECLVNNTSPYDYVGEIIGIGHEDRPQGWRVEQERAERVQMVLDYVARRYKELEGKNGIIEVIDLKDGQMWVDVKNNSQFIGYAFGAVNAFTNINEEPGVNIYSEIGVDIGGFFGRNDWYGTADIVLVTGRSPYNEIVMTVAQPKTNPVIRSQSMTYDELYQEAEKLARAAYETDNPDAPLIPGDHCTWCSHGRAGNCTAKTAVAVKGIKKMVDQLPALSAMLENNLTPETMTNEQLAEIKDAEPIIKKMLEQINDEMFSRIKAGQQFEGYGIGPGRSSKKWIDDPETVASKLKGMRMKKDEYYPVSLITPAAALKHPNLTDRQRANLEKMIQIVPGNETVVRMEREKPTAEQMFGESPPKTVQKDIDEMNSAIKQTENKPNFGFM